MDIYIFASVGLALALAVMTGAIIRQRTRQHLEAFAATLPEDERVIFWRLQQSRDLWSASRYPKAFQKWKKRHRKEALVIHEA